MICFFPPVPVVPPEEPPASPSPDPGLVGPVIIVVVVLCALIAPFGWTAHSKATVPAEVRVAH